jgi:phage shock protein A
LAVVLEKLVADQQKLLEAMEAKQVELEQLIGATKVELEQAGQRNQVLAASLDQLQVKCAECEQAQVELTGCLDQAKAHQVHINKSRDLSGTHSVC